MTYNRSLMVLMALVTLAFAWVLWPLFGAVFWAVAFAVVLDPVARSMTRRLGARRNLAALIVILSFLVLIILPTILILGAMIEEASGLMAAVHSGEIDLARMFQTLMNALPRWSKEILLRMGLGDLDAVQLSLSTSVRDWLGENAPVVLSVGQNTAGLFVGLGVMLYLMFFLIRDGDRLLETITSAIPMDSEILEELCETFTLVVRATMRGDVLVALLQGVLGGLGFWVLGIHAVILWTVLMAVLSLFPVFGAALVWAPVAVYFLASGLVWQGLALLAYGVLVISLVDNIARPWLVGQSTRIPDYIVLISTLGGISSFGMQGFITGPVIAALFITVWSTFLTRARRQRRM